MSFTTQRPDPNAGERERGPGPGDLPRWPGAPENGPTKFECSTCGEDSTLAYRCSECGAEPGGAK